EPWRPSRPDFLVPGTPLSVLCRATCRDALNKPALVSRVDAHVGHQDGGVHGAPVDRGQEAWRSLAPDLFRGALSPHRIRALAEAEGTVQEKESATAQGTTSPGPAEACMRRLLPPVLPARCVNVRSDGVRSPANRPLLQQARQGLGSSAIATRTS